MRPVRLAIAGLGAAAREIHLPAYAKVRGLEVVAGCDPGVSDDRLPFPLFASAAEMLAAGSPDILAVASPPETHYELTRLGLASGCHVFCEKPFVETVAQADELCELASQADRRLVINNQYRFMNIHRRARELIGSQLFGELVFATFHQTFVTTEATERGWRGKDSRRTCKEFGIHVLDLCRFFFGEDPVSVVARMPRPGREGGPDLLNLIQLEFSGDRVAHITLDRLCRGPHRYLTCRLDGTEATIESEIGGTAELSLGVSGGERRPFVRFELSPGGRARLYQGARFRRIATDPLAIFASATARLMGAFLEALERGVRPPCDGEDNRRTLALMLAAYESDRLGAPVKVDYGQAAERNPVDSRG